MKLRQRLKRLVALAYLIPITYCLTPLFWTPLEYRFYNFFHSQREVPHWDQVVVVGIDRTTRDEVFTPPAFPLSRHVTAHATLTRALAAANARSIAFDLGLHTGVFDSPPDDLAAAFREAGNVYLVMSLYEERTTTPQGQISVLMPSLPDSTLLAASQGAYLSQISYDADGTLRRFRRDPRLDRLGIEMLPERITGFRVQHDIPIIFPSTRRPIPIVSYADVLAGDRQALDQVTDRIALVGLVEDPTTDVVAVPRPQLLHSGLTGWGVPGVVALAAITETLLRGAPLRDVGWFPALLWNLLWCVLVLLIPPVRRPRLGFLLVCLVGLLAVLTTALANIHLDRIFPTGLLFGCIFVSGLHLSIAMHLSTTKALHEEEVKTARARHEMETARQTQKGFLPRTLPEIEGVEFWGKNLSSRGVSGDYYDVIELRDHGVVVFAIADVCGKGLPAALLMSNVQAGLHTSLHPRKRDIGTIATNLNYLVYQNTETDKFVTFFLSELEPETHVLRYVRAGHDEPFIVSTEGKVRKLQEGGLFLGMVPGVVYETQTTQLRPGDVLCLYTDGITEACNAADEEFGVDRLIDVVVGSRDHSASAIGEAILASVERFSGTDQRMDDMTLIIVRF